MIVSTGAFSTDGDALAIAEIQILSLILCCYFSYDVLRKNAQISEANMQKARLEKEQSQKPRI